MGVWVAPKANADLRSGFFTYTNCKELVPFHKRMTYSGGREKEFPWTTRFICSVISKSNNTKLYGE